MELSREDLARVLKHPLRQRLLFEYAGAAVSPSKVAAVVRQPLNLVSYHTNVLRGAGCLELVRVVPRRGAKEHYYRAVAPPQIADADWLELPIAVRRSLVRSTIDASWREVGDALERGGMDAPSAHVSRSFLRLDGEARGRLADVLRSAFDRANEIEAASLGRGSKDAVPCELVILSFERAVTPTGSGPAGPAGRVPTPRPDAPSRRVPR